MQSGISNTYGHNTVRKHAGVMDGTNGTPTWEILAKAAQEQEALVVVARTHEIRKSFRENAMQVLIIEAIDGEVDCTLYYYIIRAYIVENKKYLSYYFT